MKVLVIKHGALGDIVQCLPAFAAIRKAHAGAAVTLLTTPPFTGFLDQSPWFDEIITDSRPAYWNLPALAGLRAKLRGFDMVYDLQTSARSSRYFRLAGKPPWSGIAQGSSALHGNPQRVVTHTRERLAEQLQVAGIEALEPPDLSWILADISRFKLPAEFAALVPGASPEHPEKRWPATKFGALAAQLPWRCVVVGGAADAPLAAAMHGFNTQNVNLTGKTSLLELAAVLARARLVVGNDTGPMHLAAALGVKSLVLFSGSSDPALTAPRYPDGGWPSILRASHLAGVAVAQVIAALP